MNLSKFLLTWTRTVPKEMARKDPVSCVERTCLLSRTNACRVKKLSDLS